MLCICTVPSDSGVTYVSVDLHAMQWKSAYMNGKQLRYVVEFRALVDLCLSVKPEDRPSMREVVELLLAVPLANCNEDSDDFYPDIEGISLVEYDSETDTDTSYPVGYDSESESVGSEQY